MTETQRRLWKCRDCRGRFSVLTGTITHGTDIPVRTLVLVFFELCANKTALALLEVESKYKPSPKSASLLRHRIREAMMRDPAAGLLSGIVEAAVTWIGGTPKNTRRQGRKPPAVARA